MHSENYSERRKGKLLGLDDEAYDIDYPNSPELMENRITFSQIVSELDDMGLTNEEYIAALTEKIATLEEMRKIAGEKALGRAFASQAYRIEDNYNSIIAMLKIKRSEKEKKVVFQNEIEQKKRSETHLPSPLLLINKSFIKLMYALSMSESSFISSVSANNAKQIFDNIEKGISLPSDSRHRIDWIGTWGDYWHFFNIAKGKMIRDDGYTIFFEKYCLFKGYYKDADQVRGSCRKSRRKITDSRKKLLSDIIESTLQLNKYI